MFTRSITILFLLINMAACQQSKPASSNSTKDMTEKKPTSDKVFVMPVRKIKAGTSIEAFTTARDAYVAKLEAEKGTLTDREIQPFFDFTYSGLPLDSVYVGLTSFENPQVFKAIGDKTGKMPEAAAFFSTFDFIAFEVLQPLDAGLDINLAELAPKGSGNVWEIAIRDISKYENFNQADYEAKRDAYLKILSEQEGFVREIQWKSISDPNVVVGMTIYQNASAVQSINSNQEFIKAYQATGFIQNYPPNKFGMISNVLK